MEGKKFFLLTITENSIYNTIAYSKFHNKYFEVENFLDFPKIKVNSKIVGLVENGKVSIIKI